MKEKEREAKRHKDEVDRLKKSHAEKIKNSADEVNQTREDLETEYREKVEDLQAKLKREKERAVDKAVEKVRADLRNQLDTVKNDLAEGKADWTREKKRLVMDHETAVEERQKEGEFERDAEVKAAKERIEKLWKKKFEEREAVLEERLKELDTEMTQIRDKHAEDLRRERDRTEIRIRENVRVEIRNELADQMTAEFAVEMQKARDAHEAECDDLRRQLQEVTRTDRSLMMPRTMAD